MRLIIAGSRHETFSRFQVQTALAMAEWTPSELVCGMCRGVDMAGYAWAEYHGLPIKKCPALWDVHGVPAAGPIRNREMAKYADALLILTRGDGNRLTKGTENMRQTMAEEGKPYRVVTFQSSGPEIFP